MFTAWPKPTALGDLSKCSEHSTPRRAPIFGSQKFSCLCAWNNKSFGRRPPNEHSSDAQSPRTHFPRLTSFITVVAIFKPTANPHKLIPPMKRLLLITLTAISLHLNVFGAVPAGAQLFYYGTTEKVTLNVPGNKIIVKFSPNAEVKDRLRKLQQFGKAENLDSQVFVITLREAKSLRPSLEALIKESDVISANPIYTTNDKQEMGVTDEICLEFNKEVKDGDKRQLLKKFNAVEVARTKPWEKFFTIVTVGKEQNALEVANRIKESGLVKFAHPNFYAVTVKHSFFPNDPFFPNQFYLNNPGQATNDGHVGTPDADIDAPEAWDITKGVSTITVAVIDEGVELTNTDLPAARLTIVNGCNFAGGNA